jgi:hypothetical protein
MQIPSTCDEDKVQELQLLQSQTDQIVIKRPMGAAIFKHGFSEGVVHWDVDNVRK